eukprot:TRINITY_DN9842_c0_g3_i4.p1 TRINITY_DN9842_c0_g3~~TRINITY_DN9842_c0_g3_i4.p1  ORF type:complete len:270 (+),score=63.51 TRINITY_DN9842_c0_g3_i4:112-810(+)
MSATRTAKRPFMSKETMRPLAPGLCTHKWRFFETQLTPIYSKRQNPKRNATLTDSRIVLALHLATRDSANKAYNNGALRARADEEETNKILRQAYIRMGVTNTRFLSIWKSPIADDSKLKQNTSYNYYREITKPKKRNKRSNYTQFVLPRISEEIKGRYLKILRKESSKEDLPVIRPMLSEDLDKNFSHARKLSKVSGNYKKFRKQNKSQCADRLLEICKNIKEIIENPGSN